MIIKKNTRSNMRAVWKSKTGTNTVRDVYILDPQILLWKTPYRTLFSARSAQLLHISKWLICF